MRSWALHPEEHVAAAAVLEQARLADFWKEQLRDAWTHAKTWSLEWIRK